MEQKTVASKQELLALEQQQLEEEPVETFLLAKAGIEEQHDIKHGQCQMCLMPADYLLYLREVACPMRERHESGALDKEKFPEFNKRVEAKLNAAEPA